MNILFVEDYPETKLREAMSVISSMKDEVSYEICKSCISAQIYIDEHLDEIDLAVIDLCIPIQDDDIGYNEHEGLIPIEQILFLKPSIPIIINSTTALPGAYAEAYEEENKNGSRIVHVDSLTAEFFEGFIKSIKKEES